MQDDRGRRNSRVAGATCGTVPALIALRTFAGEALTERAPASGVDGGQPITRLHGHLEELPPRMREQVPDEENGNDGETAALGRVALRRVPQELRQRVVRAASALICQRSPGRDRGLTVRDEAPWEEHLAALGDVLEHRP
ncbi:hypothetical protein [Streptomyces sp. NPDC050560]|uniref:hypothetical protein n=1 Tax=Streptomyces sp. NPDC050560 TaxID=3365630 RepID=UPI00378C6EE4